MPVPQSGPSGSSRPIHKPVLLREVIQLLDLSPGLTVVDGTVGAGGHSQQIFKRIQKGGTLVGLDRDTMMLKHAAKRLTGDTDDNLHLHHSSYLGMPDILAQLSIFQVDRVLLDLGLSSDQLADDKRGFSFTSTGPLDLRFDTSSGQPAWQWLREQNQQQLSDVLSKYGEEKFHERIAEHLVKQCQSIESAQQLAEAVIQAIPRAAAKDSRKNPATRVFQALRIAVNQELEHLHTTLNDVLPEVIASEGKAVIITFHSLEDRMVKETFANKSIWKNLTPKPIAASAAEKRINPRCRTAKVRAAIRMSS